MDAKGNEEERRGRSSKIAKNVNPFLDVGSFFLRLSHDSVNVCVTIIKRMTIILIIRVDDNNHNNHTNKISRIIILIMILIIVINSVIFNIGLFIRTRYTSRRAKDRSITLSAFRHDP